VERSEASSEDRAEYPWLGADAVVVADDWSTRERA
jgi:hypothetical protein